MQIQKIAKAYQNEATAFRPLNMK